MTWLSTGTKTLTEGWGEYLQDKIKSEDRTDAEWVNLNTGASLVMVADGGWRGAHHGEYKSRYRVFLRAAGANPMEMTFAFLQNARNGGAFEESKSAAETYSAVQRSCKAEIERILHDQGTPQQPVPQPQQLDKTKFLQFLKGNKSNP
ncbi:hypothetical protein, partial [Arthrobacter antibioticus]|uniref:hypothetical protein n=1 Tax=Arthrobacter sp. H35-MC1 TaxID=3046203 RepID=UPI0024BA233B